MAIGYGGDPREWQYRMDEMMRKQEMDLEKRLWQQQGIKQFQDSPPPATPDAGSKKPKHLNPKLLLIKGT